MKFALIYSYDPSESSPTEGEVSDWIAFAGAVEEAGAHVYEAGFQPPKRARTISKRVALGGERSPLLVAGVDDPILVGAAVVDRE